MRVNYESVVNWRLATDLLRINPLFHGQPRYDCAIVKVKEDEYIFARLLHTFECIIRDKTYYMALTLPMDLPPDHRFRVRNKDLHFIHIRARPRSSSTFISVESIVQGALMVKDFHSEYEDEYIVFDVVDSDMWQRLKTLPLSRR